jgi:2-polyprenylphenol 6-hydroxylase
MSGVGAGRDFDFIIVGAGVIGAAMASLLIARRLSEPTKVALVGDRFAALAADADWDLRVFALSRASQRLLEACGVWQKMQPQKINAYDRMVVWDERGEPGGAGSLSFDCAELGEPNLGFIVDGVALQSQCLEAARSAGAILIEASVAALVANDEECRVRLGDGRELRGRLLIAADGTESKTRALLGIETAGHTYHQDALVGHVRTEKSHRRTAWQRFLRSGPLAFLPLPDGRSSVVWSVGRAEAARLRALDAAAFGAALTAAGGGVLGGCELTTPLSSFPLKLQYALNYVKPRAVLIGDAAHVVHPLAGQGLNLGLLDCASFADVLGAAAGARFFGEHKLLRRYERWRRSENIITAAALDGLERLFSSPSAAVSRLRMTGLDAVGHLPFVKRALALRALGLSGDVPEFLRAQS